MQTHILSYMTFLPSNYFLVSKWEHNASLILFPWPQKAACQRILFGLHMSRGSLDLLISTVLQHLPRTLTNVQKPSDLAQKTHNAKNHELLHRRCYWVQLFWRIFTALCKPIAQNQTTTFFCTTNMMKGFRKQSSIRQGVFSIMLWSTELTYVKIHSE